MQHERVGVGAKLCHEERDTLRHQAGNEMHVARETIELCDSHGAFAVTACLRERGGELGAAVKSIAALSALDLDIFGDDFKSFALGKTGERLALRFNAEAGSPLLPS